MRKNSKTLVSLDDLLGPGPLDDLLTGVEVPAELPSSTEISKPEALIITWQRQRCSCGRVFEHQLEAPLTRHSIFKRQGFGLRQTGKVYLPAIPNLDLSDIPLIIQLTEARIYACPDCAGAQRTLPLFPNQNSAPNYKEIWLKMHETSEPHNVTSTLRDMEKRGCDFDGLLTFKTTKLDLQQVIQPTCDPEE